MAKLTMFLVCAALLVTVNAFPGLFDDDQWMDSDDDLKKSGHDDSSFMSSMDDMDKDFTTGWMDMSMPDMKMDSDKDIASKCKKGDKDCQATYTSSQHVTRIENGKVLQNTDDYVSIKNDKGNVTKQETHKH